MTLQQLIHNAWQTRRPLLKRIPPEFLTYSYSPFERLPRAVFTIKDQTVAARTNCGAAAEKAVVRFTILETSFTDALGTVNLMRDVYGNKAFDLVENRKSAVFALNNFTITHDNNQWIAVVNFDVTIFTYNPQI